MDGAAVSSIFFNEMMAHTCFIFLFRIRVKHFFSHCYKSLLICLPVGFFRRSWSGLTGFNGWAVVCEGEHEEQPEPLQLHHGGPSAPLRSGPVRSVSVSSRSAHQNHNDGPSAGHIRSHIRCRIVVHQQSGAPTLSTLLSSHHVVSLDDHDPADQ